MAEPFRFASFMRRAWKIKLVNLSADLLLQPAHSTAGGVAPKRRYQPPGKTRWLEWLAKSTSPGRDPRRILRKSNGTARSVGKGYSYLQDEYLPHVAPPKR